MKTLTDILGLKEGSFYVKDGRLFLPRFVDGPAKPKYVQALSLASIVENYDKLFPEDYAYEKLGLLASYGKPPEQVDVRRGLRETLFEVLPYFVKILSGLERRKPTISEIIDYVEKSYPIPEVYYDRARLINGDDLRRRLIFVEKGISQKKIADTKRAHDVNLWFSQALVEKILSREAEHLRKIAGDMDNLAKESLRTNAFLLYMDSLNGFEIGDFGFERRDNMVYKRIGEYALKDFNGEVYLFPECRVGVPFGQTNSCVLDKYKHPFLPYRGTPSYICIGNAEITGDSSAKYTINAIDAGINALLYGYFNKEHFKGYHWLGSSYDGRYYFEEYRVSKSHPKIVSGEVMITNDSLIGSPIQKINSPHIPWYRRVLQAIHFAKAC